MTGTVGALAFLIARTTRNRFARQLARVRSPRYALALIVGLGYFWLVFGRPGSTSSAATTAGFGPALGALAGISLTVTVLVWWLGGGVTAALAFHPAEVQLLFPAPVTRRALIGYRIARSQVLLLIGCVIWALLMRRWGVTVSAPLRFLTAWALFTVMSLHRLGTALVMVPPALGGRRWLRAAGRALAVAAILALVVGAGPALRRFGDLGFADGLRAVGTALTVPPASWALAPVRLILAPLYATSPEAWARAFAVVAGVIALHLAWVFAMDVAFEDVAATASEALAKKLAAFKARRAGGAEIVRPGKVTRDWLPLAPVGLPAVAIVWKNTIALIRTGLVRTILILTVLLLVTSRVLSSTSEGRGGAALALPFVALAFMIFVLGPRAVRNDLRQDLLSLASLKSYPLTGAAVVAAEMTLPTLVLSVLQLMMVGAGYFTMPAMARSALGGGTTSALVILAPVAMVALNAMSIGIQNGAALLFPAWVRLGADSGGIEAIGQTLLVTVGSMIALLLSLIAPAVAGVVAFGLAKPALGAAAAAPGVAAGLAVLALEIALLVRWLGRVFERTDPTAIT